MTNLTINHSESAKRASKFAAAFARLNTLYRAVCGALAQVKARNAQRRAMRRAPDEILMAHARREEARREVDRLLLLR